VDTNGTATRGTVSVSGAGARLTAGTLTLGNASATGSLAVSAGGSVGIAGTSSIHGSVSLSAGTLTTGALSVAAGSSITGNGVLSAGSTVDLGTIGVTSGQLYCLGSITGSGSLTVGAKALLVLNRNVASSVSVVFGAGGGEVSVPSSSILQGTIFDWASGDAIAIKNQNVLTDSFSKGTLTLYGANNAVLGSLHFNGNLALHNFTLSHQSGAQTVIGYHG
jgi:T5SS/PEP-CTERM-associated repeat protein